VTVEFKDHFSDKSDGYAKYRPTYPDELFQFLASSARDRELVWDCATGNGQAASALANYFSDVVATDASHAQIDAASPHPQVDYRVAKAERSGLTSASVDLITVGQAFHWFERPAFFEEVHRVLRPDGVLAIWCYEVCEVNQECDVIIDTLYRETVGEFWPPERVTVEQGYSGVKLPGTSVPVPEFRMALDWQIDEMLGYLRTWSACKRYEAARGTDPVTEISPALADAWGTGVRRVTWPLHTKVRRMNTLLE
jgi:SAM-dependent methyltransferase